MSKLGWSDIMFNKIINKKGMSILGMVVFSLFAVLFVVIAGCDNKPDTGINSTIDEILSEQNAVSSILDTDEDSTYYISVFCDKEEVKKGESIKVVVRCIFSDNPTSGQPVMYVQVYFFIWAFGEGAVYQSDPKLTDETGWATWNVPVDFGPGYFYISGVGYPEGVDLYSETIGLRVNPADWVGESESDRRNALQEKEKGKIKKLPEMK